MRGLRFNSQEDFDNWHSEVKTSLGMPRSDGVTTEYTKLITLSDSTLGCKVDESYEAQVGDDVINDFESLLPTVNLIDN